jgi:hypothetical protein
MESGVDDRHLFITRVPTGDRDSFMSRFVKEHSVRNS